MDLLYDAALAWQKLLDYRYEITWGKSGKLYTICLDFEACEFHHLAGFPHMKDITFPIRFSQSKTMEKVLAGVIKHDMIKRSQNYEKIVKNKLLAVIRLEQMLNSCPQVYKFNPDKLGFYTRIEADYLLADDQNDVLFLFTEKDRNGDRVYSKSAFMMDQQDFRRNQKKMALLQFKRINQRTAESHIIYCKPGFSPEPVAV